jgi:hypothetical protein
MMECHAIQTGQAFSPALRIAIQSPDASNLEKVDWASNEEKKTLPRPFCG